MQNMIEIVKQTSDGLVFETKQIFSLLENIGDRNVAIVSLNGKQRTGKSLLINYFIKLLKTKEINEVLVFGGSNYGNKIINLRATDQTHDNIIGLRASDQTQNNGIWISSKPFIIKLCNGSEMAILLMETRVNCDDNANTKECGIIFALSLLLSSTLILNVKTELNEEMLKFVEHFTHYAQLLNGESKLITFQRLVFLVRDWDNECAYRFGYHDDYTYDQNNYKNNVINPNDSQGIDSQNMRKRLMTYFGHISSYLVPHPGKNVTKPSFSGQIDLIDNDFKEKVEEFVALIVANLEPKAIDGRKLTGYTLKCYFDNWIQKLNHEKHAIVLQVNDESEYELIIQCAYDLYEERIASRILLEPTDKELMETHILAEEESFKYFASELNSTVSNERFNRMCDTLREMLSNRFKHYRNKNADRIECESQQKYVLYVHCFAKAIGSYERCSQKPKITVYLQLPCPGAYLGSCESVEKIWHCYECGELLEYGFDGYFYCLCGKASVYSFQFKCDLRSHSMGLQFTQNQLKQLLSNKEINILLLGETGVGKSTWINGFANYLTYSSLAEAKQNELLSLIPSSFTMTDNNYQRRVITCGEDTNEAFITGQSATQDPKSYVFEFNNKLFRIIDTPGIGDTRGIEQDKKNFDIILRYLSNWEKLHGICILLKPNNARLGVMFRFCIKELLTHLHRDASRNIIFCFTNARSTFYRPGDTMPALESLLNENKEVEIKISKHTIYCMDNESFRFLCALHHKIEFDDKECNNYSESWDKSVIETKRMIEYISGLTPHAVTNTLSLNETRRIITNLTKPLADITQNILTNINVIDDKKRENISSLESEKRLKKKLHMYVIQLEAIQLGYPRTVCTDQRCVKYHNIEGSKEYTTEFIKHCHIQCNLKGVTPDSYPNPELKNCSAIRRIGICRSCGCSWEKHMHITYEQKQKQILVIDETVEDLIKNKQTMRQGIELQVQKMEEFAKELNDEKDRITVICAKFCRFLRHNSIVPYNDALGEYLDFLIRMEKDKVSISGDRNVLEGLEQMRSAYIEEVRLLNESMTAAGKCEQLMPTDIMELVNELYSLKHKGKELKQIMDVLLASKTQIIKHHETNYRSPINKEKPPNFISRGINYLRKHVHWQ